MAVGHERVNTRTSPRALVNRDQGIGKERGSETFFPCDKFGLNKEPRGPFLCMFLPLRWHNKRGEERPHASPNLSVRVVKCTWLKYG